MAWCPQCKNEYRDGIKTCVDCGCDLVEEEQYDDLVPVTFGDEEKLLSLKKYLEYNKLKGVTVKYDEEEAVYELYVRKDDKSSALSLARVFLQQEYLREQEELRELGIGQEAENPNHVAGLPFGVNPPVDSFVKKAAAEKSLMYSSSSERAEENRSSAFTLIGVGAVGLIVMILGMFGIIPLKLGNAYMFYGVMCAVFLLFIVSGVISMKNAKIFAKKAETENSLKDSIQKWYKDNLTAAAIDGEIAAEEGMNVEEVPVEILYFNRVRKIKDKLNHQFMNLDQAFLEHFIDEEVYDYIYAEEEER